MPLLDSETEALLDNAAREAGFEPLPLAGTMPTVLLVEDEPTSALVTGRQLKRVGVRVLHASDFETALSIFEEQTPDAVFVDLCLPRASGLKPEPLGTELVRLMRDTPGPMHPYLIVLTATVNDDVIKECKDAGADEIYSKSESPTLLVVKFGRVAQQLRSSLQTAAVLDRVVAVVLDLHGSQRRQTAELDSQTRLLTEIKTGLDPLVAEWTQREETARVMSRFEGFARRWWKPLSAGIGLATAVLVFVKTGKWSLP